MAETTHECLDCGRQFSKRNELERHADDEHLVQMVQKDPLVLTIDLCNDCVPGTWEAAQSFARSLAELRGRFPGRRFQLVPFSADVTNRGDVEFISWLAVAE